MSALAEAYEDNGDATDFTYGATPNDPLTWDFEMIQASVWKGVCGCEDFLLSDLLLPTRRAVIVTMGISAMTVL